MCVYLQDVTILIYVSGWISNFRDLKMSSRKKIVLSSEHKVQSFDGTPCKRAPSLFQNKIKVEKLLLLITVNMDIVILIKAMEKRI